MTKVFQIPYPQTDAGKKQGARQYGTNAYWTGKHWAKRRQDAEYWHQITRCAMHEASGQPFENPVVISFYWNDRLDLDNHSMMAKMIIDAMKGSLLHDDSKRWVKSITHHWHDEETIRVVVTDDTGGRKGDGP